MQHLFSGWDATWFKAAKDEEKLGPKDVHPCQRPSMPTREDFDNSPHYPLVMTPNPVAKGQTFYGSADPSLKLPLNGHGGPIPMESDTWKGKVEVHIKGLPTTHKDKFDGRKRLFHIVSQGVYKERVKACGTHMGQELAKHGKPPPFVGEIILTACGKVFSNTTRVDVHTERPYFMNPALACFQLINVSKPGEEPEMWEAEEDMRLMSPKFADKNGKPISAEKRRKFCDHPSNIEDLYWEPGLVYTYHVYQHIIDFSQFKLNVGGLFGLDIAFCLNGQPLQITVRDLVRDSYGMSLLIWHKRMLYDDEEEHNSLSDKLSNLKTGFRNMLTSKK